MPGIEIIKGHGKRLNYRKSSNANEIDNVSDTFRNRGMIEISS